MARRRSVAAKMREDDSGGFVMPEIVHTPECARTLDGSRPCDCDFAVRYPPGTRFGHTGPKAPARGRSRGKRG